MLPQVSLLLLQAQLLELSFSISAQEEHGLIRAASQPHSTFAPPSCAEQSLHCIDEAMDIVEVTLLSFNPLLRIRFLFSVFKCNKTDLVSVELRFYFFLKKY